MSSQQPERTGHLRIALVQMSCVDQPQRNLDKALEAIAEAAERGARVVCLPELFRWPYFCQRERTENFELAETVPGPTTEALSRAAARHQVVVVGSVFERRAAGIYHNTAVVLDANGRLVGRYRKMHLPHDPGYFEKFYFTPGDLGFLSFPTRYGTLGVLICWDQWFPEAVRLTALCGAQVVLVPTAIGRLASQPAALAADEQQAWETVQRGHAVANGLFLAVCNRVGRDDALEFWGSSFVADPLGRVLVRAESSEEQLLLATCDLGAIEQVRRDWPLLRDRRPDAYAGILKRFLA